MASAWTEKCLSLRVKENETLADILQAPLHINPEKVAVHFEDRAITYRELDEEANRVADGLVKLGVQPGDRVAIHVDNRPEFIEIYIGVMRAGAILVPTNVMYTAEEMEHILTDSGAKILFVASPLARKLEGMVHDLPELEHARQDLPSKPARVIEVGASEFADATPYQEFKANAESKRPEVSKDPSEVAIIQYTSGTTGKPKGAMVTHGNVLAVLDNTTDLPGSIQSQETDVTLCVLPLFHAYALDLVMNRAFLSAQTLILVNRFDAENVFALFEKHKVTIFYGAPPMYHAFVNTEAVHNYDATSLRGAFSGAAPLPVVILERFKELTGVEINEGYGLSETAPTLTTNAAGAVNKPGSVGPPIPGVEIRIVDDNDQDVAPGEVGEIIARGPNIFKGYWRREEETAETMKGGWFHTGDMGRVDEDGYYYIVDRKKDMIVVSGYNVYPIELENVIMRHPKVVDCAVIGVPDDYQGEAVKACIVLKPGEEMSADELKTYCRDHLAAFKLPKHVSFRDSLPKNPTGKILKRVLRDEESVKQEA